MKVGLLFLPFVIKTCSETWNILTTNILPQPITEPTHKDGNVLDLIFTNYDEPEILCNEKHLFFPDHFTVCLDVPRYSPTLSLDFDFRPYSLLLSDTQLIDIELSLSFFSFDLLHVKAWSLIG